MRASRGEHWCSSGSDGAIRYVEPHFNPGNLAAFEAFFAALGLA